MAFNRTETHLVRLSKWFPADDDLAAKIARLCILREDLVTEIKGFTAESIKELEGNCLEWRQLYFIRNFIRTLREMLSGVEHILQDREFRAMLAKEPARMRQKFKKNSVGIRDGKNITKKFRDDICGHVQLQAVKEALAELVTVADAFGYLEIGPEVHFKFAGQLVSMILSRGVPDREKFDAYVKNMTKVAGLVPLLELSQDALLVFLRGRKIIGVR